MGAMITKKFNVSFTVKGIPEEEYDEAVAHIVAILEATEYVIDVGVGEEACEETPEWDNPCPNCRTQLVSGVGWNGVKCPKEDCGYWFCY